MVVDVDAPDEAGVQAALEGRLARFKCPKRVLFVDELPRNTMGKVQKNLLRDSGVGPATWDREAAGIRVTRNS